MTKCPVMIHLSFGKSVLQESLVAVGNHLSLNDALHSTLNHTAGQGVIKIWVKFKLPH